MRRSIFAACAVALLGACASGAPPGFSGGDTWAIPLIGPLEDGLLLVPAMVNGKGPFVFAIDPDAHVSIVDADVVAATKAATGEGPHMLDESDTQQTRFFAEILSWKLGPLVVQGPKPAQIVGKGTFDVDGRRVYGVIGRDIIADSLVLTIRRADGIVVLSTHKGFQPPAGSTPIKYSKLYSRIPNAETPPLPRRLVKATIGGSAYPLHVDFGATTSQLRSRAWPRAGLLESAMELGVVDETGMVRKVKTTGRAASVSVGDVTTPDVVFVPYDDKRWPDQDIEGTLGLGFFKPYDVTINWDTDTIYLKPQDAAKLRGLGNRLGRWMSQTLDRCPDPGCVKVNAIDPLANKPPEQQPQKHPGLVTSIVRDPSMKQFDLEVLIAVTPAPGKPPLKWLVANLPAGTDRAMTHLSADYVGATFKVLDASPFPRPCPAEGACVDMLAPPQDIVPPVTPAPPSAAPPTEPAAPAAAEPAPPPPAAEQQK
ncbi:MAG TPA: retropepsin-like aspartic protease [Kofleriaceae bacterium]